MGKPRRTGATTAASIPRRRTSTAGDAADQRVLIQPTRSQHHGTRRVGLVSVPGRAQTRGQASNRRPILLRQKGGSAPGGPLRREPVQKARAVVRLGKDGKGKGDGKPMVAKGQPQDWPSLPPPPLPPSLPEPPPAVFPADSAASSAQSRLDALLASLRSTKDQLPPEISSLLGEQELEETKSHSKAFHKAVSAQEKAKKELVKVQTARRNFLNAWGSYVEKLQLLMKQQLEDQEKAMADFNQHEAKWNQQLADANKELAALSALPGGTVQQVSSDSDMDVKPESPPEHPRGLDKASRLKDQQEELAAILFRAKEKAESASAEAEQRERTPRRKDRPEGETKGAEPPPAKASA